MSDRLLSPLEPRALFSGLPWTPPALVDPGEIENFNGVKINASRFPSAPVTVQVTSKGPIVNLPMLKNGVVTATSTGGADSIKIETRNGVDPTSTLPGIVFFAGTESGDSGVEILGSVKEGVDAFSTINTTLGTALTSMKQTRDLIASMGGDTSLLDAQIAGFSAQISKVTSTLNQTLTAPFIRVTAAGLYDAYFLASKVSDVKLDTGAGNDTVLAAALPGKKLRVQGGDGNDVIKAGGGGTFFGGNGNDQIAVGAASWIEGNAGNDILSGSSQADSIIGGANGDDVLDNSTNAIGVKDVVEPQSTKDKVVGTRFSVAKLIELKN